MMEDPARRADGGARAYLTWLAVAALLIISLATDATLLDILLIVAAFAVGHGAASGNWFFIRDISQRRAEGREVLLRMSETEIAQVVEITSAGRNIKAIKRIRSMTVAGLAEAKEGLELLRYFGTDWQKVIAPEAPVR